MTALTLLAERRPEAGGPRAIRWERIDRTLGTDIKPSRGVKPHTGLGSGTISKQM